MVPSDLKTKAEKQAYRRGWKERAAKAASLAGSTITQAKADAARLNGMKPCAPGKKRGRPRKEK